MSSNTTALAATVSALVLVGAACANTEPEVPTATPADTEPATPAEAESPTPTEGPTGATTEPVVTFDVSAVDTRWDLVGIGDSFIGWSTLTEQYGEMLSGDLGIDIEVHKIAGSTTNRLEYLRTTQSAQALLADAEIVVVEPQPGPATAPGMTAYEAGTCGGTDNQECFRQAQADFEVYVAALFDELIALTPDDATIMATLVAAWGPAAYRPGIEEDDPERHRVFVDHVIALQEISAAAAFERGIPTVDVSLAFNGPDYYQPAPDTYLLPDRAHLTEAGSRVVAELLFALSASP